MKYLKKAIYVVLLFSIAFNLYFIYQKVLLSRRTNFSENILIDQNYILNKIDEKPYLPKLGLFMEEMKSFNLVEITGIEKLIIDVPLIDQTKDFPNGCEAVSATMLLQHAKYDVSPATFIDQYMNKQDIKIKWGIRYGPNPAEAYAGDPRSKTSGFGCFSPVIEEALNKIVKSDQEVLNLTGYNLEELENTFIRSSIPIMIWATVDMQEITKFCQWQSFDGKQTYIYPSAQHALVLVGADMENYYFNDPLHADKVVSYPKATVIQRYNQMGMQAIAITERDFLDSNGLLNGYYR